MSLVASPVMTHGPSGEVSSSSNSFGGQWDWADVRRRCLREARALLAGQAVAEDAAQEALIRVWRHAGRPSDFRHPEAWLARIARNEALRQIAQAGRRRELPGGDAALARLATAGESAALIERLAVEELVGRLRPGERELFHLRYREDLSEGDLARRLGIPRGTAKVRLHRLRRRLEALAEGGA